MGSNYGIHTTPKTSQHRLKLWILKFPIIVSWFTCLKITHLNYTSINNNLKYLKKVIEANIFEIIYNVNVKMNTLYHCTQNTTKFKQNNPKLKHPTRSYENYLLDK